MTSKKTTTANSSYTQAGVSCFYGSEVLNQSSVLLMKFGGKNPCLRVAAKRCTQAFQFIEEKFCYLNHSIL
jgi:hypothetical protein